MREIQNEVPELILSDLNMPGMSGFDLLSVVRRRFPAIRTIAMSGSFSGNEVPSGVAADAYFQKGSSIAALLRLMDALPQLERNAHPPACPDAIVQPADRMPSTPFQRKTAEPSVFAGSSPNFSY